jgi:hypothetical protein
MVWAKLNDTYGDDCATLSDAAFRTHTEGLGWTMRRVTEGRITKRELRRFAETAEPEAAVAELIEARWWEDHETGDGWTILHDMHYQRTRDQVESDRTAAAERQRKWREAHGKKKPRSKPEGTVREDVERLCAHLADRIEGNGAKRPGITQKWRDECRLMLDTDGRTEVQVKNAINWCQSNSFWHSKVLSMPKLREKYDALNLQAKEEVRQQANGQGNGTASTMRGGARQELLTPEEAANLDPGSII